MTERLNAESIDRRSFENDLQIYFCRKALEQQKQNAHFLKTLLVLLLICSAFWVLVAMLILKILG